MGKQHRSAGDAILDYLGTQLDAIGGYAPAARRAEDDAVHQMRVAVRRTRAVLRGFRKLFDPAVTGALQPELRWLAGVLGTVRDLEVLRMRFTGRLAELGLSEPPEWLAELIDQEKAGYERMNDEFDGARYAAVLAAIDAFGAQPPFTPAAAQSVERRVAPVVRRSWRRVVDDYRAIDGADDPDTARHDTRISAKRARYIAEAAAPALGKPATTIAKDAKRVQEAFGQYQDCVIAAARLERLGDPSAAAMAELERRDADRCLAGIAETWASVAT